MIAEFEAIDNFTALSSDIKYLIAKEIVNSINPFKPINLTDLRDYIHFSQTNKSTYQAVQNEFLWKYILLKIVRQYNYGTNKDFSKCIYGYENNPKGLVLLTTRCNARNISSVQELKLKKEQLLTLPDVVKKNNRVIQRMLAELYLLAGEYSRATFYLQELYENADHPDYLHRFLQYQKDKTKSFEFEKIVILKDKEKTYH